MRYRFRLQSTGRSLLVWIDFVRTTNSHYGQPSLVFNNVFIQLDETENLLVETPKWSLIAPPVLITGGNYYIRTPATDACSGGGFPGDLAGDFVCDIAATDPCNGLCVEGSDVMLGEGVHGS